MGRGWKKYLNLKELVIDDAKSYDDAIKWLKTKKFDDNYKIYLESISFIYDKKIEEIKKLLL